MSYHVSPQQKKTFLSKKRTILSQLLCSSYFSVLGIMVVWGFFPSFFGGCWFFCLFGFFNREERRQHVETLIGCSFPASRLLVEKENPVIILSTHGLHSICHKAAHKMKVCLLTASFILAAFTPGNKLIHSTVFCIIVDTVLIGTIRFSVSTCPSC